VFLNASLTRRTVAGALGLVIAGCNGEPSPIKWLLAVPGLRPISVPCASRWMSPTGFRKILPQSARPVGALPLWIGASEDGAFPSLCEDG